LKYYTVKQVAEILNLHPETVRIKIKDGEINAKQPGRAYLMTEEDIENYVEGDNNE